MFIFYEYKKLLTSLLDFIMSRQYFDIFRCKLRFDGGPSVTNFLERLEEMRIPRNVAPEQLLRSAVEVFTKDAMIWFRTHKFDL